MSRSLPDVALVLLVSVGCAGMAGLAMLFVSNVRPERHVATVTWAMADDVVTLLDIDAASYERAPRRVDILVSALRNLADESASVDVTAFSDTVRVTFDAASEGGGTLRVHVEEGAPELASERASALAVAVEAWDRVATSERFAAAIRDLDAQVEVLGERVRSQQVLGAATAGDGVDVLIAEYDELVERRQAVAALEASPGSLGALTRAGTSVRLVAPRPLRDAFAAALVGGVFGAGLGLIPLRAMRRERTMTGTRRSRSRPSITFPHVHLDDDVASGAVSSLVAELLASTTSAAQMVLLVTSPFDREGKSFVACHLAEELARQGLRTLLVDGNLVAPVLAERYGVFAGLAPGSSGTALGSTLDWLQEPAGPHHLVRLTLDAQVTLDLAPLFGVIRAAPGTDANLFGGIEHALRRWKGYGAVVIDSASLLDGDDTRFLVPYATATVLVVDPLRVGPRRVAEARRVLRDAGAKLVGMVMNEVSESRGRARQV